MKLDEWIDSAVAISIANYSYIFVKQVYIVVKDQAMIWRIEIECGRNPEPVPILVHRADLAVSQVPSLLRHSLFFVQNMDILCMTVVLVSFAIFSS